MHLHEKTLVLVAPEWDHYQTFQNAHLPFPLWPIGDQPLLYHWFDYAVSEGFSSVRIYASAHLPIYRKFLEEATLWPIQFNVLSIEKFKDTDRYLSLDRLPWADPRLPLPKDHWTLLQYWQALEHQWFEFSYLHKDILDFNLAIGRYCIIHPTAKINMPVWIGNSVSIGPECEIGPYATIANESIIEGYSKVTHSRIAPNTFLGCHTKLDHCYLNGHTLYNLRYKAYVPYLDPFLADFVKTNNKQPSVYERIVALLLWLFFKSVHWISWKKNMHEGFFKTTHHFRLPKVSKKAPLWQQRYPWLLSVVAGKLFIFGILPRTPSQFHILSSDAQKSIANQPVGVFSYADTQNCHSPLDPEEENYAIFQAIQPKEKILPLCRQFLRKLVITVLR